MPKKNWTKLGAMIGFVALIIMMLFSIYAITGIDMSLKYFALTIVLLLAMFIYFEFLKEYQSQRSQTNKT
jgi:TRAP-type C4-dicarboxylate transport system permease small subunit